MGTVEDITAALKKMKESDAIDLSIINMLDALGSIFKDYVERWLTSRNTKVNLYFYYAARNAQLIISRLKERFTSADSGKEVVDITLQMIGLLGDVLDLVRNERPDEAATKSVIERARTLRSTATELQILNSPEKELEDVDKLMNYMSKLRK
jgi:hypothetical protein